MRYLTLIVTAVLSSAFAASLCSAVPSQRLRATLSAEKPVWLSSSVTSLSDALYAISQQADINFGYAYLPDAPRDPAVTIGNTIGTCRDLLDKLAANVGYCWQCNGDWINLTPLDATAPMYPIMNRLIRGEVVVSTDRSKCTPVRRKLANDPLYGAQVHTLRIEGLPETPIRTVVLRNPAIWEFLNAEHDLRAIDIYSAKVRVILGRDGKSVRSIYLQ